jgi:hypothetical protein
VSSLQRRLVVMSLRSGIFFIRAATVAGLGNSVVSPYAPTPTRRYVSAPRSPILSITGGLPGLKTRHQRTADILSIGKVSERELENPINRESPVAIESGNPRDGVLAFD